NRGEDPLGPVAAAPPCQQWPAKTDREAQNLDIADARREIVAVLMHHDQEAERDGERGDRVQQVHAAFPKTAAAWSAAARRARRSASSSASSVSPEPAATRCSVLSMTSAIPVKR